MGAERKPDEEKAVKKTISIPPEMFTALTARRKALKYRTLSSYIQYLIDEDLSARPPHTTVREEPGSYGKPAHPPHETQARRVGGQK